MKEAYSTADPGTQTRAVPETGKIHRTCSLLNMLKKNKRFSFGFMGTYFSHSLLGQCNISVP